jgi:hypothetical protein
VEANINNWQMNVLEGRVLQVDTFTAKRPCKAGGMMQHAT